MLARTTQLAIAMLDQHGAGALRITPMKVTSTFGFTDDDHVALASDVLQWWIAVIDDDPWATATPAPSGGGGGNFDDEPPF